MPHYLMPDQESLYVRQIGTGEPVLILSGLGMSSWQWLPFILPSLKSRSFIIPDFRGFGGSKHCKIPSSLNAIDSHWQDIHALLQQLNIGEIDVIGYSMGATTTMHGLKYGQFSQYIKRYLHIDQSAKIKNDELWHFGLLGEQQQQLLQLMLKISGLVEPYQHYSSIANLPKDIQIQLLNLWLEFMQLQNPHSPLTALLGKLPLNKVQSHLMPLQSLQYILWYLHTYLEHDEDYRDAIASLNKPTHFIIGKQSSLYGYHGQLEIAQQLDDATIHLMDKSGHVPLMSEPVKFGKILNEFLRAS
ncbi:alpha/beta fold hydrolase [Acinetobacter puyangensis]|uniref:alpha/beta fold hydrolase n=1 Tax=Acinetobacter puyangensis TaxID=1096779 RepID=UPI003A4E48C7